jgi:hypothetical protein
LAVPVATFITLGRVSHFVPFVSRLPAEQPSDDGAEELARRALAVVEQVGTPEFYVARDQRPRASAIRSNDRR